MGFFDEIFGSRKEGTEREVKPDLSVSVYVHDYSNWSGYGQSDFTIVLPNGECCLVEIDFRGAMSPRICKPLYDYDFLVLDSGSILNKSQSVELNAAIEKGTKVVVLAGPYSQEQSLSHYRPMPKTYDFLDELKILYKFDYRIESGIGTEANIVNEAFKKWWVQVTETGYRITFSKVPRDAKELAINKANMPIAWEIGGLIILPTGVTREYLNQTTDGGYRIRQQFFTRLADFLLNFRSPGRVPAWVHSVRILDEEELLAERKKISGKLIGIEIIKKILYTNGNNLQDTFEIMLGKLGITWRRVGTEDYLIEFAGHNIVIEIFGTKHNLNSEKAIQVLSHREGLRGEIQGEMKLCLIVNHQMDKLPEERNELDNHVIQKIILKNDICLLSTMTFLKYYDRIINNRITKEQFLKGLLGTNGELK